MPPPISKMLPICQGVLNSDLQHRVNNLENYYPCYISEKGAVIGGKSHKIYFIPTI